ncbi:MAG: Mpo1-like protein [Kaistella sp.]
MSERIKNFKEFYPYYLSQHSKKLTRMLHFLGTLLMFAVIVFVLQSGKERFLWYLPIFGLGISALSHYIFEKNKPTSFQYPVFTLIGDFKMFFELLIGKEKFKA